MREERLPYSKLELMHEIDNQNIGWVERCAESLNKRILVSENQYLHDGQI